MLLSVETFIIQTKLLKTICVMSENILRDLIRAGKTKNIKTIFLICMVNIILE